MHFSDRLAGVIQQKNSCLMLGLDPNWEKLPPHLKTGDSLPEKADIYQQFCCDMVDVCAEFVCGLKIQMGYFEALGSVGVKAVENIIAYVRLNHPDLIIMMDAKRGDIGSTSEAYAEAFLGENSPLAGDCVTVASYMGRDSVDPFFSLAKVNEKGLFILVKTSNETSADIQDLKPWFSVRTIAQNWARLIENATLDDPRNEMTKSLLGMVVGATHPKLLPIFRKISPSTWILAPGVGAQGGKIEDVLNVRDQHGLGVLIPVSRSVLYASNGEDYLAAAKSEIETLWQAQKM